MIYKCTFPMTAYDMFKPGGNDLLTEVKHRLIQDMQQNDYLNGLYNWGYDTDDFDEYSDDCAEALNNAVENDINNFEEDSKFFNAITLDKDSLYLSTEDAEFCDDDIIQFSIEVNINLEKLFKLFNIEEKRYED